MRGRRFLLFAISFSLIATLAIDVIAQSTTGFLNIDCGKPENHRYTDTSGGLGLTYTSDFGYVDTGEISDVASSYANLGYRQNAEDLRSFPNGRRNCYSLKPIRQGSKNLVRCRYMYGNYDGLDRLPEFELHLGVNYWDTISVSNASDYLNHEIITVAASDSISLCLVNIGKGTPFISAIEVRPLPDDFYDQVLLNHSQALQLFDRADYCGTSTTRYPQDVQDRYWYPFTLSGWSPINTSSSVTTESFQPPSVVMKRACTPTSGSSMDFYWNSSQIRDRRVPNSNNFLIALYFAELTPLNSSAKRIFDVYVNEEIWSTNVTPVYLITTTVTNSPGNYVSNITIKLKSTSASTLPPMFNAHEIYRLMDFSAMETDAGDATAIMDIKRSFQLKRNWNGDPCAPVEFIWTGLNCSYQAGTSPTIISLNLSSSYLTGNIPPSLGNLRHLESIDLSNNGLTGSIPDFLGSLSQLKFLDLTQNNLTGPVPKELQAKAEAGILTLRSTDPSIASTAKSRKKNKNTVIIIIIVAVVCALLVAFLCVCFFRKGRRNKNPTGQVQREEQQPQRRNVVNHEMPRYQESEFHTEIKRFTYGELAEITGNFSKEIGKGGFGTVYHGTLENGRQVAIKVLSVSSDQSKKQFRNEVLLLSTIHHKNLVSLLGYCDDPDHLTVVYEYVEEGDLHDNLLGKISKLKPFGWKKRLEVAIGAAQGLEYLHEGCKQSIIHLDVKPQNILLDRNMEGKIADFGLSRIFDKDTPSYVSSVVLGTPGYIDPEYNNTQIWTKKSDVYSFGVVLLQLVTGLPAIFMNMGSGSRVHVVEWVRGWYDKGAVEKIVDGNLDGKYGINSIWKILELAMTCTSNALSERPTMDGVLLNLKECLELENAYENHFSQEQYGASSSSTSFQRMSPLEVQMSSTLLPR